MTTNGLSIYNVGTSLDLDALTQTETQSKNHNENHEESDDGEEDVEEIKQRNAEVILSSFLFFNEIFTPDLHFFVWKFSCRTC